MSNEASHAATAIEAPWEMATLDLFRGPWEPGAGVRSFVRHRGATRCEWYRVGKVALRDALDALSAARPGAATNVVLPAYVPSGIAQPIREAGYTPRYYRITPTLRPSIEDVHEQLDDGTLAIITINYFGIPQPDHDALRAIAADAGVALIEDNAHSALSETPSGTLLGTRADLGFTSFRKTMPVADGAALYVVANDLRDESFPRAGIRSRMTRRDLGYLVRLTREQLTGTDGHGSGVDARLRSDDDLTDGRDLWGREPETIYERCKGQMSRLSAMLLDRLRPEMIVEAKRGRYRDHRHVLSGLPGSRPVFGALEPGTCPQAFPIVVEEWEPLCERLGTPREALPRWPPLPHAVATQDRYDTSQYLAEHLVPLPV